MYKIFAEPFGMNLLTGPTGSGKSTTLVAGLFSLDLLGKNVITIENPIEFVVPLARQTQVNAGAGYDFSNAMRHFLRHDPDVILIGEMRDEQTAGTALAAATTGHLVLSTLHSNTALGAVPRLQSLGLAPELLAESLISVVSQRLIRTLCPNCKVAYKPDKSELELLGEDVETLYQAKGCAACAESGYIGRTLIYEILVVDKAVRQAIEQQLEQTRFAELMRKKKFRSLLDIGRIKVKQGITTLQELERVLGKTRHN